MDTSGQEATALRLCEVVRTYHREILEAWRAAVARLPPAQGLSGPVLMDHMPAVLACIAEVTDGRSPMTTLARLPEVHATDRLDRGFDLRAVITEFSLLREVVLLQWVAVNGNLVPVDQLARFDRAISEAIAVSADRFARARERTLQALDRISQAALGSSELDTFLDHLMTALRETTESVDFISILLREGDALVLKSAQGLPELLSGPRILAVGEEGFAGRVAARREPIFVRDAANDPMVTLEAKRRAGLRALYGVPLLYEDRVIGVAEMGSRTSFEFNPTDRLLFRTMSQRASALLVQAQLVEAERRARQQAEDAAARSRFLAGAGELLSASLDRDAIFRNVAALAVPELADWLTIDLVRPDGRLEGGAAAHADRAQEARLREVRARYPPDLSAGPLGRRLLAGETVLVREVSEEALRPSARDAEHLALLMSLGIRSFVSVPIPGRERPVVGILTLVRAAAARPFEADDVQMGEQLARLVGLSLENARLLKEADAERDRLRGVLRSLPVAVALARAPDGELVETNEAFHRITGLEPADAQLRHTGLRYRGFRADGTEVGADDWPLARALRGEDVDSEEFLFERPDGRRVYLLISAASIGGDGAPGGAVVAFMDISDRKRSEEFERSLTAIVGHDLRNPLQAVVLTTRLLLDRADLPEDARRPLRRIEGSIQRMGRIVTEVLDFARVQLGGGLPVDRQRFDVCELAARVAEEFEATHPGRLAVVCPASGVTALLDPHRMTQVLLNLVGNALTHGAAGRPVRLAVEARQAQVALSVHNEGAPIPPDLLPVLFDPFMRARESAAQGLGLGLFIAQHIVRAHGGRLEVDSPADRGTTFTVLLPEATVERQ